ncbi:Hpt domain-containing protein, partial [Desulfobacterales bacterium HSG17]|nr:Hpt domain-containing protein [Desulfobacterales bacterium HSG17]
MEPKRNILKEFTIEGKEHLRFMEKELLDLEKQAYAPNMETIAKIFRSIHGIKGSAGFLGLKGITKLAHAMETLLGMMRSGKIMPDSDSIDTLLTGTDILGAMMDDVEHSEQFDISSVLSRINGIVDTKTSLDTRQKMEKRIPISDVLDIPVNMDVRAFDLDNLPDNHDNLFMLKYDLTTLGKQGGISPVKLVNTLLLTGEILDSKLDMGNQDLNQDLSGVPFYYNILYGTVLDNDSLKQASGLTEKQIIKVKKAESSDEKLAQTVFELPSSPVSDTTCNDSAISESVRISVDILDKLMMLASELVLVRNQQ